MVGCIISSVASVFRVQIPLAERFEARVCGRSLAGIADLNSAGGIDVCVVCCKVTVDMRT